MSYTQTQINEAYQHAKDGGTTEDGLKALAQQHGLSDQQLAIAEWGYTVLPPTPGRAYAPPAASSAVPAPKPVSTTTPAYTQDQINGAYKYEAASGANADQLWALAQKHGVSQDQFNLANLAYRGNPASNATWGGGETYGGRPNTGINLSDLQNSSNWNVNPNETVRSQLQQIISEDSPIMQQARARAQQSANSRGLLNSSMAGTAADAAVYDAAMPIAAQDASTYARAGELNANTANTFARENNNFARDAYMADFNVKSNSWAADKESARQAQLLASQQQLALDRDAAQSGYQTARDDKESDLRLRLAQMDIDSRAAGDTSRLQTQNDLQMQNEAISNLNALRTEYADKVFRINTSELSPEKSGQAIKDLATTYNPMLKSYASRLGYDPDSWIIKIEAAPAAPAAVVQQPAPVSDSGGGA